MDPSLVPWGIPPFARPFGYLNEDFLSGMRTHCFFPRKARIHLTIGGRTLIFLDLNSAINLRCYGQLSQNLC